MKYSLRLFCFCSGTYFSLFLLAQLASPEPQSHPESIALITFLSALLFGVCMSAFLSWRQKKALDKLGLSLQEYSSCFRSEVTLSLTPEIAFDSCINSILFLEKSKIKKVDKKTGTILAHVGPSRNSWGEELTIRVKSLPNRTRIVVQRGVATI
jgi:hypothetical protein